MHLKCGVSVSKRNDSECAWVEEAEFKDVSDKTFGDFFIAPRVSSAEAVLSNCTGVTKIKRELDENVTNSEETRLLPSKSIEYLSNASSPTSLSGHTSPYSDIRNVSVQKNAKTTTDDSASKNKIEVQNNLKSKDDDAVNSELLSSTEEDGVPEGVRVLGIDDFEDDSEPVLVRPVPTDVPDDTASKRKPSFEGKLSMKFPFGNGGRHLTIHPYIVSYLQIAILSIIMLLESYSVVEVEVDSSDVDEDLNDANISEHSSEFIGQNENNKGRTVSTDSHSRISSSGSVQGVSKCVMCGKVFQHLANLRIHIQSHLGTKAQLKSCEKCDR